MELDFIKDWFSFSSGPSSSTDSATGPSSAVIQSGSSPISSLLAAGNNYVLTTVNPD